MCSVSLIQWKCIHKYMHLNNSIERMLTDANVLITRLILYRFLEIIYAGENERYCTFC